MKSFMKVINTQRRICFKERKAQESCRKWSFSLGSVTLYFTCEYQVYNNCPARPKIPDGQKLHFVHLRISASLDPVPACGDCSADTRRALLRLKKKILFGTQNKVCRLLSGLQAPPSEGLTDCGFRVSVRKDVSSSQAPGRVRIEVSSFLPLSHLDAYPPNSSSGLLFSTSQV